MTSFWSREVGSLSFAFGGKKKKRLNLSALICMIEWTETRLRGANLPADVRDRASFEEGLPRIFQGLGSPHKAQALDPGTGG